MSTSKTRYDRYLAVVVAVVFIAVLFALSYVKFDNDADRKHQVYTKFGCLSDEAAAGVAREQTTFVNGVQCNQ